MLHTYGSQRPHTPSLMGTPGGASAITKVSHELLSVLTSYVLFHG